MHVSICRCVFILFIPSISILFIAFLLLLIHMDSFSANPTRLGKKAVFQVEHIDINIFKVSNHEF